MSYANNKGADQPAHPRSLISTFFVRCLDSTTPLVVIFEISRLQLASVAAQAGLSLTLSQNPKTGFLVTRLNLWTTLSSLSPSSLLSSCEPRHDKTNKMAYAPSENSDQPGHPPSLIRVFAVRMKKAWVLRYPLRAQQRL